jgi:arabinofuranan 3-O-arabinosyltransferase
VTAAQPRLADEALTPAVPDLTDEDQEPPSQIAIALGRVVRGLAIRSDRPAMTRWVWLVGLASLIVLAANHGGQMFFDTKLGVDIDPLGFYARLWHLWNPLEWFGTLQDQYIGYAFPMAPFYLIGELLRVPFWFTERLWLALLIAVGFAGFVKLAAALRIGSERSRLAAGVAFALWPTFTIVIGSTSAGALPGLLVPWAVLPLVTAARGGSLTRAAARSGAAVLCMGGVNATSTLDVLILPALFIVTMLTGRRRVVLAGWWVGAVSLATSWWVVPLLLQARYSFNFLPYVEQSSTTTGTMSAAAFLRGAGNWTAYLNLGQPWLSAGWAMVAEPFAIMAAAVAAGAGLLGLASADLPARTWLRLSLAVAALVALAGYPGPLGGLFHQPVDHLLNSVLAPLRSVYKIEPVAAAVLALGIAHALTLATRPAREAERAAWPAMRRLLVPLVTGLLLIGLAYPYLSGQILNPGSFTAVPRYWYRVAAFLHTHSPRAPALVVPAAAHGTYLWGEPVDDPLEPLASSPWAARGLVPYGGAGSQLLLSSLSAAVSSGEQVPGLAAVLHRSGIRYIVVRNDLSPGVLDYTPPQAVHQTLLSSGFRRVGTFGPLITGAQLNPGATQVQYALPSYPAVEVYQAASAHGPPPSPVAVLPVSQTVLVNGGPDALLQLAGQHIMTSAPAVIAGDKLVTRPALWAVTDSLRRADHAFGLISATASYAYTATETNPLDDPLGGGGGPPRQLLPVAAAGHQTVAVLSGAAQVTSSSAGSWLAETPQIDPVNAFDGNPATVWAEANPVSAVGQWIQITFDRPVSIPDVIGIRLLDDGPFRAVADRLTVRTDTGSLTAVVRRTGTAQPLPVPPGVTRVLRITLARVHGGVPGGPGAGLADVLIPNITVRRFLQPPQSNAGLTARAIAFSFQRQVPSPAGLADVAAYPPLAETFVTPKAGTFRLTGSGLAVPGSLLNAILGQLTPVRRHALEVTASSSSGALPNLAAASLFGAKPGGWIAGGPNPVIRLSWSGQRLISQMVIQPVAGFAAAPEAIKIVSPNGIRYASVGLDGLIEVVPPLRTTSMTISFPVVQFATTTAPISGQLIQLPVGLSKLTIPALAGLQVATPPPGKRFQLACGRGPEVTIDGHRYLTQASGAIGDLTGFRPVQITLCSPGSVLRLGRGRHKLVAASFGPFTITDLSLTNGGGTRTAGRPAAGPAWRSGSGYGLGPGQIRSAVTGSAGSLTASAGEAAAAIASGAGASGATASVATASRAAPTSKAVARKGRSVRVLSWQPEDRRVRIGPGVAAYLEMHQNANAGWTATLNGLPLTSVRLDGWQQGFVVPAGAGGVVTLTFAPVGVYHAWIILSAVGALFLISVAFARRRRRKVPTRMDRTPDGPAALADPEPVVGPVGSPELVAESPASAGSPGSVFGSAGSVFGSASSVVGSAGSVAGSPALVASSAGSAVDPPGLVAGSAAERATMRPEQARAAWVGWAGVAALCALIAIVGGPLALAVPLVVLIAVQVPGWSGLIALAAMTTAGVLTALAAHPAASGTGAFGPAAQVCALIALIVALSPTAVRSRQTAWPSLPGAFGRPGRIAAPNRLGALASLRRPGRPRRLAARQWAPGPPGGPDAGAS